MADASSTATFLLTRKGSIVHSNAAADALVSRGSPLAIHNGTLSVTDSASREEFRAILLKAASCTFAPSAPTPTHTISLSRTDSQRPLQLLATPLPHAHRGSSGADVLLLIADPEAVSSFPDDVLEGLYGLTKAETETANGLLMGYSLQEIASLRRVSLGTVRNQLKSIMGKTAASRQSDLVRLLMALPHCSS